MKLRLNIKYDLEGIENVVIDDIRRLWRLPFIDKANRNFNIKEIKPFWHCGYTAYKIRGVIYSEKVINLKRISKPRELIFNIIDKK